MQELVHDVLTKPAAEAHRILDSLVPAHRTEVLIEMMGPGEPDAEGNTVNPKQRATLLRKLPKEVYLDVLEDTPLPLMAEILALGMNQRERAKCLKDMTPEHRAEVENALYECLDDALDTRMSLAGAGRVMAPRV